MLLALGPMATWGIGEWLIAIVAIAAAIGIVLIALKYFGVTIPPEVVKIIWIVVIAAVAIVAIKLIFSM